MTDAPRCPVCNWLTEFPCLCERANPNIYGDIFNGDDARDEGKETL